MIISSLDNNFSNQCNHFKKQHRHLNKWKQRDYKICKNYKNSKIKQNHINSVKWCKNLLFIEQCNKKDFSNNPIIQLRQHNHSGNLGKQFN